MNNFEKVSKRNKQAAVNSGKRLLKGIGDNKKSVRRVCVEYCLPTTPWTLASRVSPRVSLRTESQLPEHNIPSTDYLYLFLSYFVLSLLYLCFLRVSSK